MFYDWLFVIWSLGGECEFMGFCRKIKKNNPQSALFQKDNWNRRISPLANRQIFFIL